MAIKVFIVDDHYMIIEGMHAMLQNEKGIEWAGHACNATSCMAFLQMHQPDVILMDISMPDKSGIDLCKEVKDLYPAIAVIGLSTFNQESFIKKMIDNGASGYVLKNASLAELLAAIETTAKGKNYFSHEAAQALIQHTSNNLPLLTRREAEVLQLITGGLTNNEIAKKLFISVTTVDSHRKNLITKLKCRNTAEMIKVAMMNNLISID